MAGIIGKEIIVKDGFGRGGRGRVEGVEGLTRYCSGCEDTMACLWYNWSECDICVLCNPLMAPQGHVVLGVVEQRYPLHFGLPRCGVTCHCGHCCVCCDLH